MEDLCTTCLCADRKLNYLAEGFLYNIYQQIMNEIQVYDTFACPRICFECESTLRKFNKFKQRIQLNFRELQNHASSKQIEPIQPTLRIVLNVVHLSFSTDANKVEVKTEVDVLEIKDERTSNCEVVIDVTDTGHKEETFANSIQVKEKAKSKVKKRKKIKKKETINKKSKVKKRQRKVSEVESVNSSENDSQEFAEELGPQELVEQELFNKMGDNDEVVLKSDIINDKSDIIGDITEETSASLIEHVVLTPEEIIKERDSVMCSDDYVNSKFKCECCVQMFKSKAMMKKHHDENHIESMGPHICQYCQRRFPSPTTLARHLSEHSSRHVCRVCQLADVDKEVMIRHAREHAQYKCNLCGHESKSSSSHQSHLSSAHDKKPLCVECGKVFSSRKTYRYHINVLHKGQNRFPCPHCGKIYQWKSNLWRHIKNHKARETGELYCAQCDKKFSSVATYRQHCRTARRHVTRDQYSFVCSSCDARFVSKAKLKDHVDWEHLQKTNYRCHLCDKPFKSNTSLYVHVQNVHRNKEEKDNLCDVCGKSYQSKAKLKYHIVAMHTGATPYRCALCPAAFSWYSSLYRHVRELHHKVKVNKKPKKIKKSEIIQDQAANAMLPPVVGPAPYTLRDML